MPTTIGGTSNDSDNSIQSVRRKVKALLNKLTLERFDSTSIQILGWANESTAETDGRTLHEITIAIFEKAINEPQGSEMYARLCRKLVETISSEVKDQIALGIDGSPVGGGALFRKYLLKRCQEEYEAGCKQNLALVSAAARKPADALAKEANEAAVAKEAYEQGASSSSSAPKEVDPPSDDHSAVQKAKRQRLGLVRFIGELYRVSMLTERVIHECIKNLLANTENPEEEDIESLCGLLTTVGQGLDNVKAKNHMDRYFSRMKTIAENTKISSRIRFMIQDVLELREDRWQPRNVAAGPRWAEKCF